MTLLQIASDFREGMLNGKPSRAMCFAICSALLGYLQFAGYTASLAHGSVGDWDHYWIELEDGTILDPTADQFRQPNGHPMPKVYHGVLPTGYAAEG